MTFRMKQKTVSVRGKLVCAWFPVDLHAELTEYAKVEATNVSDVIRQMVTHCLKNAGR